MTRLLHLFDTSATWEHRVAVEQLLRAPAVSNKTDANRAPDSEDSRSLLKTVGADSILGQLLASVDARWPPPNWFPGHRIHRHPVRLGVPWTAAPALNRLIQLHDVDVIHAWGPQAVAVAAARHESIRLVVGLFDPQQLPSYVKLLRTLAAAPGVAISCATGTVQRRLLEQGVPAERCVVIRPGVDFARINAAKRNPAIRRRLGLDPDHNVLLAGDVVTKDSAHERVLWCGHLQHFLDERCRLVIHGDAPPHRRLQRRSARLAFPQGVHWADGSVAYEDLLAVSDTLLMTPYADVSTTAVAWAMAASITVVGSAVYAVAELIHHKQNGLLVKPQRGPSFTIRLAETLVAAGDTRKLREVARGQAYEVFSVRRFVEQHAQLYTNLTAGVRPAENVTDSAIDR